MFTTLIYTLYALFSILNPLSIPPKTSFCIPQIGISRSHVITQHKITESAPSTRKKGQKTKKEVRPVPKKKPQRHINKKYLTSFFLYLVRSKVEDTSTCFPISIYCNSPGSWADFFPCNLAWDICSMVS